MIDQMNQNSKGRQSSEATEGVLRAARLRIHGMKDPLGVSLTDVELSWKPFGRGSEAFQSAYQVRVVRDDDGLVVVDTGRLEITTPRFQVVGPVEPDMDYRWDVRLWDKAGRPGPWSPPGRFGTGPAAWTGEWISGPPQTLSRDLDRPLPLLRRRFRLPDRPRRARLHVSALGLYQMYVNGRCVTRDRLRPGWTDYRTRVPYQTYDVTHFLDAGDNVIGAVLADGWYAGHIGIELRRQWYGEAPALLVQLIGECSQGTVVVVSDLDWAASLDGPWRNASLLLGATYDGRRADNTWTTSEFDDSSWDSVHLAEVNPKPVLIPTAIPGVRGVETLAPATVSTPVFCTHVYDFGQNLTGWVRFKTGSVPAGTEITVRHGEMLDADGLVYTTNLRLAESTDRYVIGSDDEQTYEPLFTIHGFRYAQIVGVEDPPEEVEAIVAHTALTRSGRFRTSDPRLNRLQANIEWSARGNLIDIPTDCPQRNERLGWLGDARIFIRTAGLNFDVKAFFRRWLTDVRHAQKPNGMFPDFAPALPGHNRDGAPGWADAGVIIPWILYELTGDLSILSESYESITRFVNLLHETNPDGVRRNRVGMSWGDWLSWPEPDSDVGRGEGDKIDSVYSTTDSNLFATAFLVRSTDLAARIAEALGEVDDARRFEGLAEASRRAFQQHFVTGNGRLTCPTQTAYLLALAFDLAPAHVDALIAGLLEAISRHGGRLSTGTTGTELILPVLADRGQTEMAFQLLHERGLPSWLWMVDHGATTIWERWDSWTPSLGFQDIRMNSFNHYALGAVGAWLYTHIAGVKSLAPGFQRVVIQPQLGPYLSKVLAVVGTPYGSIAVSARKQRSVVAVHAHLPGGVEASTDAGQAGVIQLSPGCHRYEIPLS